MSGYTRTTKTYQYGGGSGGRKVVETRTVTGPDGTRTETRTFGGDGGGGWTSDFGGAGGIGFKTSLIGDFGGDINSKFGNISISGGGGGSDWRGGHITVNRPEPKPAPKRYTKGWGSRRETRPPPGPPMQLQGKSYEEIKAQCVKEGRMFEDPDFPAVDSSIFYSKSPPRTFQWKRPHELCQDPSLFVGGASRFDVKQGELGDCWLLAAVASLSLTPTLLNRVVPPDQSFDKDYCGIFRFQFWQYGKWVDVVIDDRLPTYYGKLVFMHSADKNEFWTPLVEKAYAKLHGSYEALKGGSASEAMEDFTGGVTENYEFRQNIPNNMFQIMKKAHERGSMMSCSIEADPSQFEAELANGLIMGHAYSVTDVKLMDIKTRRSQGKIPMVRVRNPWGNECEWKGSWSDKSPEWQFISEEERRNIGLTFSDDGEFWMSFQDFTSNFQKLEICNLGPEAILDEATAKRRWEGTSQEGSWRRNVNAGGCRNYLDTFWTNPQYRVEVVDPDEDDDETLGTLLVALMQKERRKKRKEGLDLMTIGYVIYKMPDNHHCNSGPLDMKFFKYNASVAKSPSFINMREVCGRHKLPPGHYCIVPSTFEPNSEGDFLVRIYSEKANISEEIDEETGMADVQKRLKEMFPPQPAPPRPPPPTAPGGSPLSAWTEPPGQGMGHEIEEYHSHQHMGVQEAAMVPVVQENLTEDDVKQEDDMRNAFRKIAGEDMEIDAYELQDIVNSAFLREFKFEGFSADTCRSMVAMMDADRSGKLGFDEFQKLWNDLRLWKSVFKQFDKDKSGNFNSYELRQAFHAVGFRVSNGTFNALVQRYTRKDGKIHFDDFIHCTVRLKTMFDIYKIQTNQSGKAEFGLDEFIQTTMYS